MIVIAGMGCRKGVSGTAVLAALAAAVEHYGMRPQALATAPFKTGETGFSQAARALGLPLVVAGEEAFEKASLRVLTHSSLSLERTGCPSVSEAAALAAAGAGSRLLAPRLTVGAVTVAFAVVEDGVDNPENGGENA